MFPFVVCSGILFFLNLKLIFQKSFPINQALVLSPILQTTSNLLTNSCFSLRFEKRILLYMLLYEKNLIETSMNKAKCKTQLFQVFQNDAEECLVETVKSYSSFNRA